VGAVLPMKKNVHRLLKNSDFLVDIAHQVD
jgi:hypothetical protein